MADIKKDILPLFASEALPDACYALLEYLNLSYLIRKTDSFDFEGQYEKKFGCFTKALNEVYDKVDEAYYIGLLNPDYFKERQNATIENAMQTCEAEAKEEKKPKYDTLMLFAVDIKDGDSLTRSEQATLTRAFNRLSFSRPVILFIRSNEVVDGKTVCLLSIANCERTDYIRKAGEKVGRVSVLRYINCENAHRGHCDIIEGMKIEKKTKDYDKLFEQWKNVFSSDVLTESFYKELYNWYRWATDRNSPITFPNKVGTPIDDQDKLNVKIIRLITRLLFVWFIKEKRLVPEVLFDEDDLQNILVDFNSTSGDDGCYYNAILQNLFFATLNNPIELRKFISEEEYKGRNESYGIKTLLRDNKRKTWFKESHEDVVRKYFHIVPNMNCGLFECLDKYAKCDIDTSDDIFLDGFSTMDTKTKGTTHFDRRAYIPNIFFFAPEEDHKVEVWNEDEKKPETIEVSGLFRILNKYKFTVEENTPIEAQISLDPELLGKVFENLLASYVPETQSTAREASGSYYTPRTIVEYMVNESLVEYLKTKVDETKEDVWRQLIGYEDVKIELTDDERKKILDSLLNCKVLDPACGSGAFPMGMLQQMVHIINQVDSDNKLWRDIVINHTMQEMEKALQNNNEEERNARIEDIKKTFNEFESSPDYTRKLYIIENCIFGSDIQPIAMLISKLRFFISLICDQKDENIHIDDDHISENYGINTLPNLETKFVAANSLLKADIRSIKDDDWTIDPQLVKLKDELLEIRHKHFLAKTQKAKLSFRKQDEKKRQEIKAYIKKSTSGPDPIRIAILTKQIEHLKEEINLYQGEWIVEELIDTQKSLFGDESEPTVMRKDVNKIKRDEIKSRIKECERELDKEHNKKSEDAFDQAVEQITDWNPYSQIEPAKFFDPDWMFGIRDGFDIVVGNPPYIELSKNNIYISLYTTASCMEMYSYFFEQSFYLLKRNGILAFITASLYIKGLKFEALRNYLQEQSQLICLEVVGDKAFKNVKMPTAIYIAFKQRGNWSFNDLVPGGRILPKMENAGYSLNDISTIQRGFEIGRDKVQKSGDYEIITGTEVSKYIIKKAIKYITKEIHEEYAKDEWYYEGPRLLIRETGSDLTVLYIEKKLYSNRSLYSIKITNKDFEPKYLLGCLNSKICQFYYSSKFKNETELFPKIRIKQARLIPIPQATISSQKDVSNIVEQLIDKLQHKNNVCDLQSRIDHIFYCLYGLSYEEACHVEGGNINLSEEDYNKLLAKYAK